MELTGKTALVTGPAKGMGRAITLALAAEGADLVLAGRDRAAIEPVAAEAEAQGAGTLVCRCDVTDAAQVAATAAAGIEAFGAIDILVNVAGGTGPLGKSGIETTPEEFDAIMALNVKGCFLTMRAVLPSMIARGGGKIVNVGGTFGLRGRAGRLGYSASKWGLRGLTKSFALEVGPHNVNVNCVAPGMVDGPRFRSVCAEMADRLGIPVDEARARHAEEYALRRVSTDADVANAVLFLVSERARQITGQDLAVDGGWVI
jgi:3-oxoacyl-[acyl-carrier protein] reductase